MIYRIAEFFDRIERERPELFRLLTSGWALLILGVITVVTGWYSGLYR